MAETKGYEEGTINAAYEAFKETYDNIIEIGRMEYDGDIDELAVFLTNGKILTISGDDVRKYLVKVEIVSVNNESLQSCQGKKLGAVVEAGGAE